MAETTTVATRIRSRLGAGDPVLNGAGPFRSLACANALSLTGNEGYEVTLLLLASAAYGQVLSVGWLGLVFTLPAIVASPLVGAWLDRAPAFRGTVMRVADLVRAVLATSLALLLIRTPTIPMAIYLAAASITVFDAVFTTALRASIPGLIRADDPQRGRRLNAANSMLVTQTTMAQIVAPAVFVFALRYISPVAVVLLDVLTFLASFVLLRRYAAAVAASAGGVGPVGRVGVAEPESDEPGSSYFSLLRDGFSTVRRDSLALALLIAYAISGGIGFALLLSVPRLVVDRDLPQLTVGISFSALAGGALLGARLIRRPLFASRPLFILIGDPVVRAVVVTVLALTASAAAVVAGFFLIGICAGLANVSRMTMIQIRFGDEVQGRMMSFYFVAHQLLTPAAPILWASVASVYGITASYLMIAGIFLVASLVLVSNRGVREQVWRA